MSIALEMKVRDLEKRIAALESRSCTDDPVLAYTEKFGAPPHHRMKTETILEKLGWKTAS